MEKAVLSKRSFFGAAIGTLIEYYDFVLFIIFLPILSPLFFPANTPYQSLMKGYFVLMISAVARPLGGIFFGYLGDTRGRRMALLCSMYGIAIATLVIGLTPSYAVMGDWAIAIILLAKVVQVFCFGGEFNGAGLYVVEHANRQREGLVGSLFSTATLFGSLLASLMGVLLTANFMPAWSWRLAFILGGLMGLFAVSYRKKMLEVPHFKPADAQHTLTNLVKKFPKELRAGIFIGGLVTVPYMTAIGFIMPVLLTKGVLTKQGLMLGQTVLNGIAIITLLVVGFLVDAKTPVKIMRFASWLMTFFTLPILFMVDQGHWVAIFFALMMLNIMNEIFLAPCNAYLKNLFSMPYRYRGISLSFGLGMSFFGSLTPIIEGYLYQWTGYFSSASLWLMLVAIGTLWSLSAVAKKRVILFPAKIFTNQ